MKKVSAALLLTAALSLGVSAYAQTTNPTGQVDAPTGQATNQKPTELKDVPAGHWASAAIQVAQNCGIIRGFPDGTFRGNEPVTRYQAAAIIARLLDAVKNGECGIAKGNMTPTDMTALENAVQELSADLAQLGVRVAELEDNAVTQDDLARVEEIATQARDLAEQAAAAGGADVGNFATQDDLARVEEIAQQARDLAEALANQTATTGEGGMIDPGALSDLTDQVEAASIAADTALAQARELQDKVDEISGRVDDLEGQLGEIGATVEGQADSIAALNDLVVLLNQDVLSLQDRVTDLERQVADGNAATADALATFATQDDLDSLREFTTLLRRDQTALADRVGELEGRVGAIETRITGVESRVTVLENNGFTVAGTLSLNYYRATTWDGNGGGLGKNFDVDRLFFGSPFSSGSITNGDYNDTSDFGGNSLVSATTDYGDFGNKSINGVFEDNGKVVTAPALPVGAIVPTDVYTVNGSNKTPYGTRIEGNFDPGISLSFTFKPRALLGSQTNGVGNNFTVALTLALDSSGAYGNPSDGSDTVNPVVLKLTKLATKYTVGGAPLSIAFGIKPGFKFTDYGFSNSGGRGDGFVATLDGAGLLPLNLTLTTVYGSRGGNGTNVGGTKDIYSVTTDANGNPVINKNKLPGTPTGTAATTDNRYFVGFRGTASLIPGFTGGVYYAVEANDILSVPNTVNLYGLNFGGALGPIALSGEYNVSTPDSAPTQVAGFAKAKVDLGIFTIATNYRVIDKDYNGLGDNGEYKKNQRGFGIDLGLKLGFATINLYYDQRTAQNPGFRVSKGPKSGTGNAATRNETDFGVNLTLRLIGFDIAPYLTRENETDISGNPTTGATRDRTRYGVDLTHDGSKPDALIGGLNLAIGYNAVTDGLVANTSQTTLYAYADTSISLVGFSIAPKAYFSSVNTNGLTFASGDDVTNYGGGLTISGGFIFGSTISLAGALDQSSHTNNTGPAFTSSTGWISTSLAFNPSIFGTPSTFKVAFASRTDANRDGRGSGPDLGSPIGDGAWGGDNGGDSVGLSSNLSGLYFTFSYYGLDFNYGIFALSDLSFASSTAVGRVTFGQAFSIKYSLKF